MLCTIPKCYKSKILLYREQDFQNYVSLQDYRKAIQLALALEQPGRLLSLFKKIRSGPIAESSEYASQTGSPAVDEVIRTLAGSDLAKLLRYIRDWNANAKTSDVAQTVLYAVFKLRSAADVMNAFGDEAGESMIGDGVLDGTASKKAHKSGSAALKDLVEALIPYTERHLARVETLIQDSYVVDYILGEMDDGMFNGDDENMDGQAMDLGKGEMN